MAQYSLNAYDADVWIQEFKGIGPKGDHIGDDLRYAVEARNVETPTGILQPVAPAVIQEAQAENTDVAIPVPSGSTIKTGSVYQTARNSRAKSGGYGSAGYPIVCANNIVYGFMQGVILRARVTQGGLANPVYGYSTLIGASAISTKITANGYASSVDANKWSFAQYESNEQAPSAAGVPNPTMVDYIADILLMSNQYAGMFKIKLDSGSSEAISTPIPFRHIAIYKERVWGCTSMGEELDTIYYSKPYDYSEWDDASTDIPEDGAGCIRIPSFDGDYITGLFVFGDSLLIVKADSIWKLTGSDPSNFNISKQYGQGTPYPDTFAVDKTQAIFVREDGLYAFDGMTSSQIMKDFTDNFWDEFSGFYGATIYDDKYILSGYKTVSGVNKGILLVYDRHEGTLLLRDSPNNYAISRNSNIVITDIPGSTTGARTIRRLAFDSWKIGKISPDPTIWTSPWIDLGRKTMQKGGFEVYFTPEVKDLPVTFNLSIETEKKKKTKMVTIKSTTLKGARTKRVHFGGAGRRFRLIIETKSGNTNPWRLIGGIHIVTETDID